MGEGLIALLADIRSPEACREIVNETISTFSSLFGLVNNAGLTFTYIAPHRYRRGYSEKFFELSDDVVQNVMDTNFVAADRMARQVTPHLIKQGDGRLVNVTTRIETMTKPGASPYGPSKAALENASEVWVKDLEDTGVTVNILNPGGAANTEGLKFPKTVPLRLKLLAVWLSRIKWLLQFAGLFRTMLKTQRVCAMTRQIGMKACLLKMKRYALADHSDLHLSRLSDFRDSFIL